MTSRPDQAFAPGCFGSAMTFIKEAPECVSCPFAHDCEPLSIERLAALRSKLGITVRAPKLPPAKKVVVEAPSGELMTMPRKADRLLKHWDTTQLKVTEALAKGINPFTDKPRFLKLVCHMLLRRPEGL